MDKIYTSVIQDVADKYNITYQQAHDIWESQFGLIRSKVQEIDFKSITTKEDFDKVKGNFNLPRLMKFYADFKLFRNYLDRNLNAKENQDIK